MKKRGINEFNDIPSANPSPNNFDALNTPETGGFAVKNDEATVNDENNSGEYFVAERNRKRMEKARGAGAKITSVLVSATALTVFAGSLLTGAAKPNVSLEEVLVEGCSVSYSVAVDDSECKIELSNYFESYVNDLQEGKNEGDFENLTPNMEYTLTVYKKSALGGKTKLEERKITTEQNSTAKVTRLNGVETECKCAVDGYFYFTMDLVDENGYYSNFRAVLTDHKGNAKTISFDDPHISQRILVRGGPEPFFGGEQHPATLEIFCTSSESGENKEISIYKNDQILI